MYLPDTTSAWILVNGRHPSLTRRLLSVIPEQICISSVTVGELEYRDVKSS